MSFLRNNGTAKKREIEEICKKERTIFDNGSLSEATCLKMVAFGGGAVTATDIFETTPAN